MLKAELNDFSRGFQLRAVTIADSEFGAGLTHHGRDFGGAADRHDHVIDGFCADEDPLPPVTSRDARAGLIAFDHPTGDDLLPDLFGFGDGAVPRALEYLSHTAFAQVDAVKAAYILDDPLIAQMLLLFVIDHDR